MSRSRRRSLIFQVAGDVALALALARGTAWRGSESYQQVRTRDDDEAAQVPSLREGEAGRGRQADTPAEIPLRGWRDILSRVYRNIGKDRVIAIAAGVTFYSLLAIFPAIAAFVAIYSLFADPATVASNVESLSGLLPGGAIEIIREQMTRIASHGKSTLGWTFVSGLLVSLWSANAGVKSLFDALNLVYNEEEKRGFIKLNLLSMTFTIAGILFAIFGTVAVLGVPVALGHVGLGSATELIVRIGRWPVLLVLIALALAFVYRHGPSRSRPKWRWISWGSAFAAIVWIVLSILFSWYAANFGSYNQTYGSLGAVVGFMIWLWLSTIVILVGAELDAEMEHQTARDTTTGGPKQLGARGASMADTVGAPQE
jgi:membrane protein